MTDANSARERDVNAVEREAFLQSIKNAGYAGIAEVQNAYHAMPIDAHRQEFLRNKRGARDGQRAALFLEAGRLKNASARVLAFFVAISRMGYRGTVCPEDVLAAQVVATTGGLCAPRTFRRALADLCARGWLHKQSMATGTKILTPSGWTTLQVNQITIPWCTRLLGVRRIKSKMPDAPSCHDSERETVPANRDVPPRPNMPPMGVRRETPPAKGGSSLSIVNIKSNPDDRNEDGKLVTPPPATQPSPTSAPLKHQTIDKAGSARKAAQRAPAPFGRLARSKIPATWHNARKILLHDLSCAGVDGVEYRIASLQTDLTYPPLFPDALPWERYITIWLELDWKTRRRIVRREIMPRLAAWCMPLTPPPPEALRPDAPADVRALAEEQDRQYERTSQIMRSLPELLITEYTPRFVAEKMQDCAWHLSMLPMQLFKGLIGLDDISRGQRQAFAEMADLLGLRD